LFQINVVSKIITRGLRRQLKLGAPQQPIHEAIYLQEQQHFQHKGIRPVDVHGIEPQQPVIANIPLP
jgi:hypothetical protein